MHSETVFVLLFAVATAVAIAARRWRVPYTVALVVAGLVLGLLHALEPPHLTQRLLFTIFLPGLLFEAAYHMPFRAFWRNRITIFSLAIPGVAAAIGLTAVILAPVANALDFVQGFNWRHALVFGALIAATDPIAVVGLFKTLGVPRRLGMLIEGESLLNDGTAIVFFTLILGLVSGATVSASSIALDFARVVGIGALIGGIVGMGVSQVIRRLDDPMIEITLTTIAAYGSFIAAETFHDSGVIATVVAGMICGNYAARTGMSPSTRVAVETFWEYVAFALNSIVFLLIGFEVKLGALIASWQAIIAAFLAVLVGRAIVVSSATALLRLTRERIPRTWAAVLTWGGLRGGLSMVLVLSLPADFPHRGLLTTMTFGVVILSILVQGLSMAPLLRRLGIVRPHEVGLRYQRQQGDRQAASAAQRALDDMEGHRYLHGDVVKELREEYQHRIDAAEERIRELHIEATTLRQEELKRARRHLLVVEKDHVQALFHDGTLGQEAYEALLADIDARLMQADGGHESGSDESGDTAG
jgi:Na+:H+ antiporter